MALTSSMLSVSGTILTSLNEIQARSTDEPRSLVIGSIEDKVWSAVITYRSEMIRIISVRRSRKLEVAIYEG